MIKTISNQVGVIIESNKQIKQNNIHNKDCNNDKKELMEHTTLWWCPKFALITIILSYISFHSISSHKEFRFILPILPLVCILSSFPISRYVNIDNYDEGKGLSSATRKRKRKNIIIILFFLFNYPHLFFLGMIHQRAPISVNQAIANHIHKLNELNYSRYSIHYLMGCHSTPLYSHLHVPTLRSNGRTSIKSATILDTWTLDCSPNCRKDSSCESDEFYANPFHFIMKSYSNDNINIDYQRDDLDECYLNPNNDSDVMNDSCQVHTMNDSHTNNVKMRSIPDFLAIFDNELLSSVMNGNFDDNDYKINGNTNNVKDVIENEMGLFEVGKFRHSINGIQLRHSRSTYTSSNRTHYLLPHFQWTKEGKLQLGIPVLFGIINIEISFDHIILYTIHKRL